VLTVHTSLQLCSSDSKQSHGCGRDSGSSGPAPSGHCYAQHVQQLHMIMLWVAQQWHDSVCMCNWTPSPAAGQPCRCMHASAGHISLSCNPFLASLCQSSSCISGKERHLT
jgi:hypothetical protein